MKWFQAAEAKLKADLDGLGALREPGKVSLESLECLSKSWRSPGAGDTKVVSLSAWCCCLLFVVFVACCFSIYSLLLSDFFPPTATQSRLMFGLAAFRQKISAFPGSGRKRCHGCFVTGASITAGSWHARLAQSCIHHLAIWLEKRFPPGWWNSVSNVSPSVQLPDVMYHHHGMMWATKKTSHIYFYMKVNLGRLRERKMLVCESSRKQQWPRKPRKLTRKHVY